METSVYLSSSLEDHVWDFGATWGQSDTTSTFSDFPIVVALILLSFHSINVSLVEKGAAKSFCMSSQNAATYLHRIVL